MVNNRLSTNWNSSCAPSYIPYNHTLLHRAENQAAAPSLLVPLGAVLSPGGAGEAVGGGGIRSIAGWALFARPQLRQSGGRAGNSTRDDGEKHGARIQTCSCVSTARACAQPCPPRPPPAALHGATRRGGRRGRLAAQLRAVCSATATLQPPPPHTHTRLGPVRGWLQAPGGGRC